MHENDIIRESLALSSACTLLRTAMRLVSQITEPSLFPVAYEARNRIVDEYRFLVNEKLRLLGEALSEKEEEDSDSWNSTDESESSKDRIRVAHEQALAAFESIEDHLILFNEHPAWHGRSPEECVPEFVRSNDCAELLLAVSQRAASLRPEVHRIQCLTVPQCAREIADSSARLDLEICALQDQFKRAVGWPFVRSERAKAVRDARATRCFRSSKHDLEESLLLMDNLLQCFCSCADESALDVKALTIILRSFIEPTSYGSEDHTEE